MACLFVGTRIDFQRESWVCLGFAWWLTGFPTWAAVSFQDQHGWIPLGVPEPCFWAPPKPLLTSTIAWCFDRQGIPGNGPAQPSPLAPFNGNPEVHSQNPRCHVLLSSNIREMSIIVSQAPAQHPNSSGLTRV